MLDSTRRNQKDAERRERETDNVLPIQSFAENENAEQCRDGDAAHSHNRRTDGKIDALRKKQEQNSRENTKRNAGDGSPHRAILRNQKRFVRARPKRPDERRQNRDDGVNQRPKRGTNFSRRLLDGKIRESQNRHAREKKENRRR